MRSPLQTTSEPIVSVELSTASATKAYEFPTSPATNLITANPALITSPSCARRWDWGTGERAAGSELIYTEGRVEL